LQDFDVSHEQEHFEDADADEEFQSVQDDLEYRHAEGAPLILALMWFICPKSWRI